MCHKKQPYLTSRRSNRLHPKVWARS